MPTTIIRLAAGRNTLSEAEQAMCFMAGANAVFTGEQMLTTPCTLNCAAELLNDLLKIILLLGSPWDEVSVFRTIHKLMPDSITG